MGRFDGKVALITGSSNGIGRSTAILFAREGAKVTITGRDANALKVTKEECLKAGAKEENILDILGDITTTEVQDNLIEKTVDKFGKIDILVNNHGGGRMELDKEGNFLVDAFDATMNQNCKSTVAMCVKAMSLLKETKGDIVIVSSIASTMATESGPFYAMSKAALDHLTRILALKYAKDGIRVNALNPGAVETAIYEKLGMNEKQMKFMHKMFVDAGVPMGRTAQPMEMAEIIAFLADRKVSEYITGQTIVADGGTLLQHAVNSFSFKDMIAKLEAAK